MDAETHELVTLRVPCEVYSRIVGYLRPVQNWNEAKQHEFSHRKVFKVDPVLEAEDGETVPGVRAVI